jgi:hypothetical protein
VDLPTRSSWDPRHGVVAILDALGTGALPVNADWRSILERRVRLVGDARGKHQFRVATFSLDPADSGREMPYFDVVPGGLGFSDTIVLTYETPDRSEVLLRALSHQLSDWYITAVQAGELFRGAIAVGDYYRKGDLIIGPAVNDAGKVFESQNWAGVTLAPSGASLLRKARFRPNPFVYLPWLVASGRPDSASARNGGEWALCWPTKCEVHNPKLTRAELWAQVAAIFLRGGDDPRVRRKLKNTKAFFDHTWKLADKVRERDRRLVARVDRLTGDWAR